MRARSQSGAKAAGFALWLAAAAALGAAVALSAGCSNIKHHRALSFFFDGVPEPEPVVVSATPEAQTRVGRQLVQPGEHGPFAAKLCDSCHDSKATNALVVPAEQLCLRCHELGVAKAYVHGPLASGGCLVCHDPHRSANRYLLVSASDGFCLHCHDRGALSPTQGHAAETTDCTSCHDAHMSDRRYLLREGK